MRNSKTLQTAIEKANARWAYPNEYLFVTNFGSIAVFLDGVKIDTHYAATAGFSQKSLLKLISDIKKNYLSGTLTGYNAIID